MLQIQLSNMLLSSNSNTKNRKNNDNIFDSVQKTMFTNDNINRWTRFLQEPSNTTIVKSKKNFPKKTVIPKEEVISASDTWIPRINDKLLWTMYVICNGREEFDRNRDKLFKAETEFKYGSVEKVRTKLSELKAEKIKIQELEAEIVSAKIMSIDTLRALAIVYEKSIIFKNDCVYYDMPFGDKYYIIEKSDQTITLHLGEVSNEVEKIKKTYFYVNPRKKIRGISNYTAKDVREIANKLSIETSKDGKQLNKQQLYTNIITKVTKLT